MELLAPAGSFAALKAAVQAGCDAVYLGSDRFSARRDAVNFSSGELCDAIEYCHLRGVKVYVAANTLVKESEAGAFMDFMAELNSNGTDAIIIQDIGMAERVKNRFPELCLHASTQMTVSSLEGVEFLRKQGFKRVVLARELTGEQIAEITSGSDCETEVFVHGAICQSYSGQCLMSSIIGGRSGNRGMCAQPCRLPYELVSGGRSVRKGHLLSPKDMCLVNEMGKLKQMGVTSLKIEGRLKRPEYVATVVSVYNKYRNGGRVSDGDMKLLTDIFCRSGFTNGYFTGKKGAHMMCYENPANTASGKAAPEVERLCRDDCNERKLSVSIFASAKVDSPFEVTMIDGEGNCGRGVSGVVEKAIKAPTLPERIKAQVEKLGATPFVAVNTEIDTDPDAAVSAASMNEARRRAAEALIAERTKIPERPDCGEEIQKPEKKKRNLKISVSVNTKEQLAAALENGIERIYVPEKLEAEPDERLVTLLAPVHKTGNPVLVENGRAMISNVAQLERLDGIELYGDFRLNIYNQATADFYSGLATITLSPELNMRELAEITPKTEAEVIAYGRLPLMLMENCPAKACGACGQQDKHLVDRRGEKFPIICTSGCISEIENAKPLYMADKIRDLERLDIDWIRLRFTDESKAEASTVIGQYKTALEGGEVLPPKENTFTRGHFYRGVE